MITTEELEWSEDLEANVHETADALRHSGRPEEVALADELTEQAEYVAASQLILDDAAQRCRNLRFVARRLNGVVADVMYSAVPVGTLLLQLEAPAPRPTAAAAYEPSLYMKEVLRWLGGDRLGALLCSGIERLMARLDRARTAVGQVEAEERDAREIVERELLTLRMQLEQATALLGRFRGLRLVR